MLSLHPGLRVLLLWPLVIGAATAEDGDATGGVAGLWLLVDDASGRPRAEVHLSVRDGVLSGNIVRGLKPGADPEARCERCPDDRRGQPLIGLEILRGLHLEGSGPWWAGGTLLDPDDGQIYRVRPQAIASSRLLVRGYVGPFYRTQNWTRLP